VWPFTCWDCGFKPHWGTDVCLLWVLCCQVVVSASGRSLTQRSPTKCGESECGCEASIMRRPWLTRGYCDKGGINQLTVTYFCKYTLHIGNFGNKGTTAISSPHEPKPGRACISVGKSYTWSSHDTDLVTNDPKCEMKAV